MGIANDVKNLGADIVTSYNARVKTMGTLVKETQNLARDTHIMLDGFNLERKEMSARQARDLDKFMADLTKNVGGMIKGFSAEHKAMAASLKASLKENTREIETYVKSKLREFSAAHAEMSAELKKDLAQYVANIVNGTGELLTKFYGEREILGTHWQAMAAVMARKRGRMPISRARKKVFSEKELVEKMEKIPGTVNMALSARVLEFLSQHPEGALVSAMEGPLGASRIKLGLEAKKLLDNSRVRKENNLYFPL
ncbi:MAG: hypothetical protein WCL37_00900 [Chrysiogenales bacterium]